MKFPNRLHVMVDDATSDALDTHSRKTGMSVAEFVRRAIAAALKKVTK